MPIAKKKPHSNSNIASRADFFLPKRNIALDFDYKRDKRGKLVVTVSLCKKR